MTQSIHIRNSASDDVAALESLYRGAFPEEDLLPLVEDLLRDATTVWSLVGTVGPRLVAHVIFTPCAVSGGTSPVALLGPLAVAPEFQGRGFGTAIVRTGLRRLEDAGTAQVLVLGDPAYYARFGFQPDLQVAPPYPLPAEWEGAWQSRMLGAAASPSRGILEPPRPWLQPALWAP